MTSRSAETVRAIRAVDQLPETQGERAVQDAIEKFPPVFNTHSQAFLGRLMAEEQSIKELVADIDAKIADLNAQRTDAMLAESGVTAAINAIKSNR